MGEILKKRLLQSKFQSVHHEAILNLLVASNHVQGLVDEAFAGNRITSTQYNVLRILRGAGAAGLCRNEIGQRLVRQVPDVTRLLDRMEEVDLIVRQRGDKDRRYVTTTITKKGLDLLKKLDEKVDQIHREQLGHLEPGRLQQLVKLLDAARHRP